MMMRFGPERDVPVGFSVPASSSVCRGPRVGDCVPPSGAAVEWPFALAAPPLAAGRGPHTGASLQLAPPVADGAVTGGGPPPPESRTTAVSALRAPGGQSAVPGTEPRVQETARGLLSQHPTPAAAPASGARPRLEGGRKGTGSRKERGSERHGGQELTIRQSRECKTHVVPQPVPETRKQTAGEN